MHFKHVKGIYCLFDPALWLFCLHEQNLKEPHSVAHGGLAASCDTLVPREPSLMEEVPVGTIFTPPAQESF